MGNDEMLNLLWSGDYARGRQEAEEMLTPEEKMVKNEETNLIQKLGLEPTQETCHILNIYSEQGEEELIRYFFLNLKYKKFHTVGIILKFFKSKKKMQPVNSLVPTKVKISEVSLKKLIEEAQRGRQNKDNYNPAYNLGQTLFGRDRFIRMLNGKI